MVRLIVVNCFVGDNFVLFFLLKKISFVVTFSIIV